MTNDIDHQEFEVDMTPERLIEILENQIVELHDRLQDKEEECSELIEVLNFKNEHILDLAQRINQ